MEKRSRVFSAMSFIAGILATTIIGDINGWFLSQKFPFVVNISGFQINIGLVSLFTLFMLVMMMFSFYLGFFSPFQLLFHVLLKKKGPIPLSLRIARIFFFPLELFLDLRAKLNPVKEAPQVSDQTKRILEQLQQGKSHDPRSHDLPGTRETDC